MDLYCKLCDVICTSLPNLKQHYDGKKHAKKTSEIINKGDETDSTITGSVDKTVEMKFCEVCDKSFSGRKYAVAHYNSKKHKNKVCEVCDKNFSGPKSAVAHDNSKKHKNIVCKVCDQSFSGPKYAVAHYNSQKHKNKVAATLLSCSPCSKKYCTKELWQRHCETKKHKKKVKAIEEMKNFAYCRGMLTESLNQETESGVAVTSNPSEVDETEAEMIKTTLKCSASNKTFSGISNANDHLNNSKHKKLLLRYKGVATKPVSQITENCVSVSNDGLINFEDTIIQTFLPALKCSACDKTLTGIADVNTHLKSKKHKRNIQSAKLKVAIAVDSFLPLVKGDLANQLGIHMGANPNASTEISSSVNQDEIRPVVDLVKPDIQPVVEEGGNDDIQILENDAVIEFSRTAKNENIKREPDIQPVVEEGGNDDIQPVVEEGGNDDIQILENDAVIEFSRTAKNENIKREPDIQPVVEEGGNDDIQILEYDAVIEVSRTVKNENRKRECENLELQAAKKQKREELIKKV